MNWGILGGAAIAKTSVIPALLSIEENALIAVASRTAERAEEFAQLFGCEAVIGYENLLASREIEAVYIPLPTGMHYEWVTAALRAGKHVLVEKSASTTLAEAEEMVALARQKNLLLVENFQFQHHSQHQFVKDLMHSGELGELRGFRSAFGFPPFALDDNIRYDPALGGGALLDSGAYVLKATSFMLDGPVEVKTAHLAMHPEFGVDWYGSAFLVNEALNITSEVSFGFDNFYQCNYEIWGSKGKLTATRAFTAKKDHAPVVILETPGKVQEIPLPTDDHFRNMLTYFNDLVKTQDYAAEWDKITTQARLIQQVKDLALK